MLEDESAFDGDSTPAPSESQRAAARQILAWQQSRRRDEGHFDLPVQGFGDGMYTLWLPSPKFKTQHIFINGKPVRQILESCFVSPEIEALRYRVLSSFSTDRGMFEIDVAFMEYVAGVLQMNYRLSDADLTMLLAGNRWHPGMIEHMIGGEDMVELLGKVRPIRVPQPSPPVTPIPPAAVEVIRKPSFFARLFRRGR